METGADGLVYVSLEDMGKHGFEEADLKRFIKEKSPDPRWKALVEDLCQRASVMQRKGTALAEANYLRMQPDCAFILALIIGIYDEMLRRIAAAPQTVLAGDPILKESDHRSIARAAARRTGYKPRG